MSVIGSNVLAGASGQATEFAIERSLRFNSGDSASLSLGSYSGSGTFSCWVKRCKLGSAQTIITNVAFAVDDTLNGSTAVFRDTSAWMHIVVSSGGTYVNGTSVGSGSAVTPSAIGSGCDLYLAEVHFVDGQALAATDFGEHDDSNVWQPKEYSGSYGTNGFYLKFDDNSSSSALGTDSSGNSNTWTVNNLSVASGSGNDSLFDSPTNGTQSDTGAGGEVSGNYCTFNPLDANSQASFANGNLDWTATNGNGVCRGTIAVSSGKWYWEYTYNQKPSGGGTGFGILEVAEDRDFPGGSNAPDGYLYYSEGSSFTKKYNNGSNSDYGADFAPGDVIGVALDMDGGTITFYKNGSSQGQAYSGISGTYAPSLSSGTSTGTAKATLNAGQRAFAYSAPSGYKALCTTNLPTPTVADGSDYFDVALYTGNGTSQSITGLGFSPDFVWTKQRNTARNHGLYDIVRGATNRLTSNGTNTEVTDANLLTSFDSNGFSVGNDSEVNESSGTYVGWAWNAGSSTVSNTDGNRTCNVRASAASGFSIVSWAGNRSSGTTLGHELSAAPELIIVKNRDVLTNWMVYHKAAGHGGYLALNSNSAFQTASSVWDNTAPTSSVFTVGQDTESNGDGNDMIAYCYAPVDQYSSFGSFQGNGSSDGPFVYTGFKTRWLMIKSSSNSGEDWLILDTARDTYNDADSSALYASLSHADNSTSVIRTDILSNGFKCIGTNAATNASGYTYIYAAFAEHPFKTARGR